MSAAKRNYKIVITGPVGAGKTTAVKGLSDIEVVSTEEIPTDGLEQEKKTTTVAMDYGILRLGNLERVHLYGTPGQARFDFMWEILSEGGLGIVILIDNSAPRPLDDLQYFLDVFSDFINTSQLVVGITHMEEHTSMTLSEYNRFLVKHGFKIPVLEVDARERDDMSALLQAMLYALSVRRR